MKEWSEQLNYLEKNKTNKLFISEGKYYSEIKEIKPTKELICCIEQYNTKKGEKKLKLSFKKLSKITV